MRRLCAAILVICLTFTALIFNDQQASANFIMGESYNECRNKTNERRKEVSDKQWENGVSNGLSYYFCKGSYDAGENDKQNYCIFGVDHNNKNQNRIDKLTSCFYYIPGTSKVASTGVVPMDGDTFTPSSEDCPPGYKYNDGTGDCDENNTGFGSSAKSEGLIDNEPEQCESEMRPLGYFICNATEKILWVFDSLINLITRSMEWRLL